MNNGQKSIHPTVGNAGLTKREHFAGLILQAILSNQKLRQDCMYDKKLDGTTSDNCFSVYAVKQADELLKQLENGKES